MKNIKRFESRFDDIVDDQNGYMVLDEYTMNSIIKVLKTRYGVINVYIDGAGDDIGFGHAVYSHRDEHWSIKLGIDELMDNADDGMGRVRLVFVSSNNGELIEYVYKKISTVTHMFSVIDDDLTFLIAKLDEIIERNIMIENLESEIDAIVKAEE